MEAVNMIDNFLRNPQTNTLAVLVLIVLVISWIVSILLISRDTPVSHGKNWFTKMMLAFTLSGIPAVVDLLQTNGVALIFAVIVSLVLGVNILVLVLHITENVSHFLAKDWSKWSILVLVIGGLAVSGYFILIKLTDSAVMCGPSQGCTVVQNSRFATLFGVVSMGEFGFAGNLAILAGWLVQQYAAVSLRKTGTLIVWSFCIFGVIFSIYLTFLEPFVIGATCMWCIMSAVFMMLLLLNSTPAAQQALNIADE
jgi:uncharacterized membrane protein